MQTKLTEFLNETRENQIEIMTKEIFYNIKNYALTKANSEDLKKFKEIVTSIRPHFFNQIDERKILFKLFIDADIMKFVNYCLNHGFSVSEANTFLSNHFFNEATGKERQKYIKAIRNREQYIEDNLEEIYQLYIRETHKLEYITLNTCYNEIELFLTIKYYVSKNKTKNEKLKFEKKFGSITSRYYNNYENYIKNKNDILLETILKLKKEEDKIFAIIDSNINFSQLKNSIRVFLLHNYPEKSKDTREIIESELANLIDKAAIVKFFNDKFLKSIPNKNEIELFKRFLISKKTKQEFCIEEQIQLKLLTLISKKMEQHEPNLYEKYIKIINQNKNAAYFQLLSILQKVIEGIENNPDFSIVDLKNITDMSLEKLKKLAMESKLPNKYIFLKFYSDEKEKTSFKNPILKQKSEESKKNIEIEQKRKALRKEELNNMKIEIFTAYNYNEILKNIIKEISQKSSFTILDYYLITKVPINVLYDYSVKVNSEYQKKLKTLLLDVTNQQVMSQEEIDSFIEINKCYKISQKRFQIEKYEKENLINYLKSLNIPLYNKIVLLALKRYLLGELQITEKQL